MQLEQAKVRASRDYPTEWALYEPLEEDEPVRKPRPVRAEEPSTRQQIHSKDKTALAAHSH